MNVPRDLAFEVTIFSEAPAGGSTGTSAAVTVALIGALDRLTPGRLTPHEVAAAAQRIETEILKQQCGIQDQLCSAYGGINYIEMFHYPHASVSPIVVPNTVWWELERRLALIYLGRSHSSSEIHEMVIRELECAGPDSPKLEALRRTASRSRDALFAGDFGALGRAMNENTEAQRRLHPEARQRGRREGHRHRQGPRRARMEGQRGRRRGRLADPPLRRPVAREAGHDQGHRSGRPGLPVHPHLPQPPGIAGLGKPVKEGPR